MLSAKLIQTNNETHEVERNNHRHWFARSCLRIKKYQSLKKYSITCTKRRLFETLNSTSDMKTLCIDSTLVKTHQHSCGTKKSKVSQDIGDSHGGRYTCNLPIVED